MSDQNDTWAKWVAGIAGIVLVAWMGFITINLIEMKTEVTWIKKEAESVIQHRIQVDASQDVRISKLEDELRGCIERTLRAEIRSQYNHEEEL